MPNKRYHLTTHTYDIYMKSELSEIKGQFEELQKKCREYLPKVDPALIEDLLLRQMENPGALPPMYMVEVFLEPGIDSPTVREAVLQETGTVPAIYDNGTHVAAHHRLTLELLKKISEQKGVVEVTGEYDTGNWAASHEHIKHDEKDEWEEYYYKKEDGLAGKKTAAVVMPFSSSSFSSTAAAIVGVETQNPTRERISEQSTRGEKKYPIYDESKKSSKYLVAGYTAAGIIGAIALAGFIISGGMPPNSNSGIQQQSPPSSSTGTAVGNEAGLLYGYVGGLSGLPAIGTTVVAANQATGQTTSAFVSLTGQYSLDLQPGRYQIVVAFPNGVTQVLNNIDIVRGATHELNLSYQQQQQ